MTIKNLKRFTKKFYFMPPLEKVQFKQICLVNPHNLPNSSSWNLLYFQSTY